VQGNFKISKISGIKRLFDFSFKQTIKRGTSEKSTLTILDVLSHQVEQIAEKIIDDFFYFFNGCIPKK
jgi:hypothetical protein